MTITVVAFLLFYFSSPQLHAQANFYEGKTAKIIAGFGAGSVDDSWSHILARICRAPAPADVIERMKQIMGN